MNSVIRTFIILFLVEPTISARDVDTLSEFQTFQVVTDAHFGSAKLTLIRQIQFIDDSQLYYLVGHFYHSDVNWFDEPFALFVRISPDGIERYRPFNRTYQRMANQDNRRVPSPVGQDLFFLFAPSWPLRTYDAPRNASMPNGVVVSDLLNTSKLKLTDQFAEDRRGVRCQVLVDEEGLDTATVLAGRPDCVVHRSWSSPGSNRRIGELWAHELAECKNGKEFPSHVELAIYADAGEEFIRVHTSETRVTLVDRNLSKLWSEWLQSPGLLAVNPSGDFSQVTEGGSDQLTNAARILRLKYKTEFPATSNSIHTYGLATIAVVLAIVCCVSASRYRAGRRL